MRALPQLASVVVGLGIIAAGVAPGLVPGPTSPLGDGGGDVAVAAAAAGAVQEARDGFPHLEHQGLFPLCTGCHSGVPDGDAATVYPEPSVCTGCHDGVDQVEVEWTGPPPDEPDLLAFTHAEHIAEVAEEGDDPLDCRRCHTPDGGTRMQVEPLEAGRCLSCHGHPAEQHVVDADCTTCHVPLAESRLSGERIAGLYEPPSHDAGDVFILELHGEEAQAGTARCATCHTRETCTSCHVADNPTLNELPAAPPQMVLPAYRAQYPAPPSHSAADFESTHGAIASVESCGTCHTQNDCASCHLSPLPRGAAELPRVGQVQAPGVGLMVDAPATHAAPWFPEDHGSLAAADNALCATCHTEPFCASCHDAPDRPAFHPENYLARHPADAWGATLECASCHDVETTCRACHAQTGRRAEGRLGPGYHDAEPLWLLRHGQAARQSLESCASCHTQRNCLQCHSTTGAFQVNPHGSSFDAARVQERNPGICRACHVGDPLAGDGG